MNIVIIKGNTTRDPEMRYLPNGTPVCQFGVAVNRKWKSESGELKEEVSFFDVEAWSRNAENVAQYFGKGSPIIVTGRLKQETWDDKQTGQKRSKIKIVMERFEFCGDTKKPAAAPGEGVQPDANYDGGQPGPSDDGDNVPF